MDCLATDSLDLADYCIDGKPVFNFLAEMVLITLRPDLHVWCLYCILDRVLVFGRLVRLLSQFSLIEFSDSSTSYGPYASSALAGQSLCRTSAIYRMDDLEFTLPMCLQATWAALPFRSLQITCSLTSHTNGPTRCSQA